MFLINRRGWFTDPFAWYRIIAWILLSASLASIIFGVILLRSVGKPTDALETTTQLVTNGIYRFIRHPLYASLLYLTWGFVFKSPSILDGCLVVVASAFLFTTARTDEAECRVKFGNAYADYIKKYRNIRTILFF